MYIDLYVFLKFEITVYHTRLYYYTKIAYFFIFYKKKEEKKVFLNFNDYYAIQNICLIKPIAWKQEIVGKFIKHTFEVDVI